MQLNEMAMSRMDAMDKCIDLGRQFIEHFHKVYAEGKNSKDFVHHCTEMQSWLNYVRSIKLKTTNRYLTPSDLIDWFFTAGECIDADNGFDTYEEIDLYNEFFLALAANKDCKVINIATKLLYY